jgi:hypothetical protein
MRAIEFSGRERMAVVPQPPMLEYSRRRDWRRRAWRLGLVALVLIGIGGALIAVNSIAASIALRRRWQSAQTQLRVAVAPASVVSAGDFSRPNFAGYVSYRPPQWEEYDRLYVGKWAAIFDYAYIGWRTDAVGVSRIVMVQFAVGDDKPTQGKPGKWSVHLDAQSFEPVSFWSDLKVTASGPAWTHVGLPPRDTRYSLYAGQPDPADASRFTIDCDGGNGHFTIDGQLLTDGTVTLTSRPGPTTVASSTRPS